MERLAGASPADQVRVLASFDARTSPTALAHSIKRSEFAADCELHPGLILEFSMPNGESLPGTILEFDDQMVKVDFNHPLAGQTVRFTVKIIKVENPPSAEIH